MRKQALRSAGWILVVSLVVFAMSAIILQTVKPVITDQHPITRGGIEQSGC